LEIYNEARRQVKGAVTPRDKIASKTIREIKKIPDQEQIDRENGIQISELPQFEMVELLTSTQWPETSYQKPSASNQ